MITPSRIAPAAPEDSALLQSDEAQAILRAVEAHVARPPQEASLLVQAEAALERVGRLVPGWRTSEFWMTTLGHLGLVASAIGGVLPPRYAFAFMALSQAAYNISRGWAKSGQGN